MEIAQELGKTEIGELLIKYDISYAELISRCKALGIEPQACEGIKYVTGEQVAVLDDVERHIQETGGMEGYTQVGTRSTSTEVDKGLLVISEASDMEQITQMPTTNVTNTNTVQNAQLVDAKQSPRLRVQNNPNRGLNAARVRDAGELYAEEEVMARAYANRLVENMEEMPPEILKEIEAFMDNLDAAMPKPKRKTAEDIANELFKDWGFNS